MQTKENCYWKSLRVRSFVTAYTQIPILGIASSPGSITQDHQAPLSMDYSRQEYWNGIPFPSPEELLDPGIKPGSPTLQEDSLSSEPPGKPSITQKELKYF